MARKRITIINDGLLGGTIAQPVDLLRREFGAWELDSVGDYKYVKRESDIISLTSVEPIIELPLIPGSPTSETISPEQVQITKSTITINQKVENDGTDIGDDGWEEYVRS